MQDIIESIAKQTGVSEQVVIAAAAGCVDRLVEWCGGEQEAINAISDDPCAMMQIAISDWMKAQRKMAEICHMNPRAAAAQVLEIINNRAAH